MQREWVVGGGGLDGYFGEQGLPAGIQECLERFHRGCLNFHPSKDLHKLFNFKLMVLPQEHALGCFLRNRVSEAIYRLKEKNLGETATYQLGWR